MKYWLTLVAILLGGAAIPQFTSTRLTLDLVILILIFAAFATAWNIAGGQTGLFSLGHGAIFAIGAYTSALLYREANWPMLVAFAASAVAGTVLALFYGVVAGRLRGHFFALATLAIGMTFFLLLQNLGDLTGADEGITIPYTPDPVNLIFAGKTPYVYLALALYGVSAAVAILLYRSRWGLRMRAVGDDEITAHSIGVPVVRTRLVALSASGALSALAGAVFACYTLYVTPANTAAVDIALQPALMAIIGGMTSVFGPLLGAVGVVALDHYLMGAVGAALPGLADLVYGALLIIAIIAIPGGMAASWRQFTSYLHPEREQGTENRALITIADRPETLRRTAMPAAGIELRHVSVRRGGMTILDDLTLHIPPLMVTSIIGSNGAGKTSALNVMTGFLDCDTGSVVLRAPGAQQPTDEDLTSFSPARRAQLGVVRSFQQTRGFATQTVHANITTAALMRHRLQRAQQVADELIDQLDLGRWRDRRLAGLPAGSRKLLEVARVLAASPRIALFDEILAGLTGPEIPALMRHIRMLPTQGITVVLVEHHMKAVMAYSDHIIVLDAGRTIATGSPADISADLQVRAAYLGG